MKLQIGTALALLSTQALAEVTVSDPWARASLLASRPGVAYLTIHSSETDTLIKLTSPLAAHVMIHDVQVDAEGVARMRGLVSLEVPAGRSTRLAPGKTHLMLMGLASKLQEGASFPLTLTFEKAGEITIQVPILGIGATAPRGEQH